MSKVNRFSHIACAMAVSLMVVNFSTAAELLERYSIAKTDNGFIRTDSQTGHTSICAFHADELICRASLDELSAFEATTQRLQDRVDELEREITKLQERSPSDFSFGDKQGLNNVFDMMESFMTRFFDMAKDLKPKIEEKL